MCIPFGRRWIIRQLCFNDGKAKVVEKDVLCGSLRPTIVHHSTQYTFTGHSITIQSSQEFYNGNIGPAST